jgi:TolA-binding protein
MKDPDRLVHRASDELVLSMLHAARKEAPHSAAKQRTVMAFAAGASVLGISGSAAAIAGGAGAAKAGGGAALASASAGLAVGAGPATGTIGSAVLAGSGATSSVTGTTALLVAKWLGLGAVSGVLTAGTANELTRPSPTPVVETSAPTSARETPRLVGAAAPPIAHKPAELEARQLTLPSEPAKVARFESAPPARADDSRALVREVASIDGAREALRTRDPDRALAELSRYERAFPSGSLAPEALYLQLEALLQRKDRVAARRVAEKLLRAHPQSPQAARARAVLARSNP